MSSQCLVKAPYDSRTYTSQNVFKRQPEGKFRTNLQDGKKDAWEKHRCRWGTAIYELPARGTNHADRLVLRDQLLEAKLPPCSMKGHRHYGALAEPMSLLEGDIDIAEKGASKAFYETLKETVMGFNDTEINSAAKLQRGLNQKWNDHGAFFQPHTQACLEYATSLKDIPHPSSTQQSDYVEHKNHTVYQPLQHTSSHQPHQDKAKYCQDKAPFAEKAFKQQNNYTELISNYYRELYKEEKPVKDSPKVSHTRGKPPKSGRSRCASTTPTPSVREQHRPTRRSSSAMLRAVSEATSTSEVSCSLASIASSTSKPRETKLASNKKITDKSPSRQMDLRRSDQKFDFAVPPVEYFLSESVSTQTNSGEVVGLNPLWPPSNKSEIPERIGYPHLSLPLGINTQIHEDFQIDHREAVEPKWREALGQTKKVSFADEKKAERDTDWDITTHGTGDQVKSQAHRRFNLKQDWVPRIWDYNYLLFHLNRRHHMVDTKDLLEGSSGLKHNNLLSCHASHIDGGLIG